MSQAAGHASPGPRILVVEDEAPMRMALEDILKADGYRVLTAADGQTGLEAAISERPDLVLLDVMLPKVDGLTICAELRSRDAGVPVLMLTARGQVADRVAGLDTGADDYLVKPFSTDELLARVRALLRRQQRTAEPLPSLQLGDVVIDFATQTARRGSRAASPDGPRVRDAAPARRVARQAGHPRTLPRRRLGIHGVPDDEDRGHAHGHAAGED